MKLVLAVIILLSINAEAQFDFKNKTWNDEESVGFGCSIDGRSTAPVHEMTQLFTNKRFDEIRQWLHSDTLARQFVAIIVLEKLSDEKKLELTQAETEKISAIKNSEEKVAVCAGCTYWDEVTMKELFREHHEHDIHLAANIWVDRYYKYYYRKKSRK